MSTTITELQTLTFQRLRCSECDIQYFIPQSLYERRLADSGTFYCPNGHTQHFCDSYKTRCEKAQTEASALRARLCLEQDQRAAAEKRMESLKKRVKAEVCPCCKRSFLNLQRHIAGKHPTFAK